VELFRTAIFHQEEKKVRLIAAIPLFQEKLFQTFRRCATDGRHGAAQARGRPSTEGKASA
jgi:hypothetical protein